MPMAATLDGGSCVFGGCTDPAAFNFNPLANIDDSIVPLRKFVPTSMATGTST